MAGDWIKMRTDLGEDPAVILIASMTGEEESTVVGRLHKLWSWADRQSRNGHDVSVTETWLDRYVGRDGFAIAMAKAGWLHIDASGVSFPNFERHNGKTAKNRALANQRKVTQRSRETSRIERDKNVTREEKRRITPIVPGGFAAFVEKYPRSRINSKRKALAIWQRDKLEPIAATIVAHVERMASTPDWKREGGKYVPNVTTYLNDARWETGLPVAADQPRELAI